VKLRVSLEAGETIDGYLVGERLHAGAMGVIHRVTREGSPFPMAMKVPLLGKGEDASGLLGFETEAMILPALQGRHVPRFVAAGALAEVPYLVMEWIEGESLAAQATRNPRPAQEVAAIGAAIAEALHELHHQGAIHLDLKPENVLLRADGEAVLIDFGLAHHARFPDLLAEERRFLAGSAPYIAPEPARGVRHDPRSDLFSLGVVLYELATARLPFGTPLTLAGLRDRLWMDPAPPSQRASVPPWLQEIILRCLEPDPEERYQAAAHVAFDLRNPGQVQLTERAAKSSQAGFLRQTVRWWKGRDIQAASAQRAGAARAQARVVMVAVDTRHQDDDRHPALQEAVARILAATPQTRLLFVSVVPVILGEAGIPQLEHRVRLRAWAKRFALPPHSHSMHVLESASPAAALLDFARANLVDLIVLGAPGPEAPFAWWRSAASTVASQAPCSVYMVRAGGATAA